MRYQDFSASRHSELPKIDWGILKLLWHSEYWDGPKDGLLVYEGAKYWFQVFEEPDDAATFRRFLILELSPEQLREEEHWHDLFEEKVGTHTGYDESGRGRAGTLRPQKLWHEFYDAYVNRSPQDFSANRLLGWFEY